MSQDNLWVMLGKEEKLIATRDLYEWSLNFDSFRPWNVFLDLIGYSEENIGSVLADYKRPNDAFGFIELDKLGDALKEYAVKPEEVIKFIDLIITTEIGEEAVNE